MKLVVGNQKNYLTKAQIKEFINGLGNVQSDNVIICPSSIYFHEFEQVKVLLGGQNVSCYDSGANTGELSSEQLKSIGINFCIVGHSERRQKLNESIEDTNIKIQKLLSEKIIPILCVGETREQKDMGKTKDVIVEQLDGALKDLLMNYVEKVVIAYEPIWSISSVSNGIIATNQEIEDVVKIIKGHIKTTYHTDNLILYGGSVNINNIEELNKVKSIDGYLIGGASTKASEFLQIINKCK